MGASELKHEGGSFLKLRSPWESKMAAHWTATTTRKNRRLNSLLFKPFLYMDCGHQITVLRVSIIGSLSNHHDNANQNVTLKTILLLSQLVQFV